MMSVGVIYWWGALCAVAAFNVVAWSLSAVLLRRRKTVLSAQLYAARRLQLILSAGYVLGCAFRSAFPVFDIPRQGLVDSVLSSVLIGRSVATVAELCFVAQWAVMLREAANATGSIVGRIASRTVLPLIVVAETCSWYSVLTTANMGHIAEESLWGVAAALLVAAVAVMSSRCSPERRPLLLLWCAAGAAYVAFMFLHDVPMYWTRWVADLTHARPYLTVAQGMHDVAVRRVVSYRWIDWKNEVPWMSLYFSAAVWFSISLIHAPAFRTHSQPMNRLRSARYAFSGMTGN
jgi:hypothetical protein